MANIIDEVRESDDEYDDVVEPYLLPAKTFMEEYVLPIDRKYRYRKYHAPGRCILCIKCGVQRLTYACRTCKSSTQLFAKF
jgi:hypothetical protein